jgi:hypothetical protein
MHQNLPFTIWNILKEFDPEKKGYLPRTRFYKISYIIHTRLKRRNIQTGLPWCWYIYGPEVQIDYIPPEIYVSEDRPDGTRLYYGIEPKNRPPEKKDQPAIMHEIKALQRKHPRTDELIRDIYTNPPKKVLSLLKEYDDLMESLKHGQSVIEGDHAPLLISQLDRIERSYSEKDFGEMYSEFLRLDDLIRLSMKDRPGKIGELGPVIHSFREIVATKASALFNENVPDEFIESRMALMKRRLDAYKPALDKLESALLKDIPRKDGDKRHIGELAKIASDIARGQ